MSPRIMATKCPIKCLGNEKAFSMRYDAMIHEIAYRCSPSHNRYVLAVLITVHVLEADQSEVLDVVEILESSSSEIKSASFDSSCGLT